MVTARRRRAAAAAVPVLAGLAVLVAPSGARATTSFSATASADVVHVSTFVVDAPLAENLVDAGSPSAAAALDDVGNSTAQAAAAYPGATIADNPGTIRGTLPVPAPVPDVPFIASSRYPTPSSTRMTAGPYTLTARSEEQRSTAETTGAALDMGGIGLARASAVAVTSTDGTSVLSRSSNDVSGVDGQSLRIATVHSLARVAYDGSRTTTGSEFSVSGFAVAGTALQVGPEGITLAGQHTPLPPTSPLLQILADQGLHVRYLAPVVTRTSVLSAGLQIDKTVTPPAGSPVGTATQSLVLGRSAAALSNVSTAAAAPEAAPPAAAAPVGGSPSGGTTGSTSGSTAGGTAPDAPAAEPTTAVAPPADDLLPPAVDPGTPPAGPGAAPATAPGQVLAAQRAALPRALDLYPPFVVLAVGLVLISQSARLLGVRRP